VSDLLLTYKSLVSVARTDNNLRMIHLSVRIRTDNSLKISHLSVQIYTDDPGTKKRQRSKRRLHVLSYSIYPVFIIKTTV